MPPVSIELLSRMLGDKRRQLKSATAAFQAAVASYESALKAVEDFHAANNDALTDELQKQLDGLQSTAQTRRQEMLAAGDVASGLKDQCSDLEIDLQAANHSNALDDYLTSSAGGVAGGDGDSGRQWSGGAGGLSDAIRVLPPTRERMEHNLGCFFQAHMIAALDRVPAADVARNFLGNEQIASAMAAHDHSRGGSFVPHEYASFYIELLAQQAVLRSCGIPTVPITGGSMTIPKVTDGVIGGYRGEEENIVVEEVKTGDITLIPKELGVIVPMTEKLLRTASPSVAAMVRGEMLRAGAALEDRHFLRGAPSGAGPTGLRWRAAAANIIPFSGALSADNILRFLAALRLALVEASVMMTNPWWITSHGVIEFLGALRNANGFPIFPEVASGKIGSISYKATNYIPSNLADSAVGGDSPGVGYTELMLIDAAEQVIGDVPGMSLDVSREASYTVGSTTVSAFQKGQVLYRLLMENDIHTRHEESIAVGVDIEWPLLT